MRHVAGEACDCNVKKEETRCWIVEECRWVLDEAASRSYTSLVSREWLRAENVLRSDPTFVLKVREEIYGPDYPLLVNDHGHNHCHSKVDGIFRAKL